ncbi:MAG: hypothetical protein KBA05_03235 [Anaerolineaceae bacterium]|jgi:hypothetical protein|nr:hypothetical protein [Anaerolineaceae bacterium]MDI9530181.1 hypothetical protein [Chloroflexota bacterium]
MEVRQNDPLRETKFLFIGFLTAFLLGLGLRLLQLGEMRFTLVEARLAQSSWQMAGGIAPGLTGNLSYAGLSAVLFRLFEPSPFFARLVPVLVGSSLILLPWYWREKLGGKTALILAFGLAFDPLLFNFSRQILTPVFVLAGLGWTLVGLKQKKPLLAGSSFALAFLGGYGFWAAALIAAAALAIWRGKSKDRCPWQRCLTKAHALRFLVGLLSSLLLIGSGFLLCPNALGGIGAGIVDFARLFTARYEFPVYQPMMIAIAYSLLPLGFAVWRLIENLRQNQPLRNLPFLAGWGGCLLLTLLLGRQDLGLLAFAAVFAWLAGVGGIADVFRKPSGKKEIIWGVRLFQIVILVYIFMAAGRLVNLTAGSAEYRVSIFALAAGFLLFVISILLAGLGWSRVVSEEALQGSLLVFLLVVSLAINLRGIHSNQESATLSILAGPIVLPNDDVRSVVDEIDRNGRADKTEITYDLGDLDSGFAWFFRKQAGWKGTAVSPQADLALSVNEAEFSAVDAYRGRNVVLYRSLDRRALKPGDFWELLLGEPLPLVSQQGVLWTRSDLFIGAN